MRTDRRGFIAASAAAGGALSLGLGSPLAGLDLESGAAPSSPTDRPARALSILILGGTNLTGPHNVRYAVERGHSVTIFTRGQRQPGLFQDVFEHVEHLIGDRADNLEALEGRSWDAVIDASGMEVEWTKRSVELLKDSVGTYMYISSTGVFYPYLTTDIKEDTELVLEDRSDGENVASSYGVMKALSEIEARKAFGERATIVRPGYIVGPLDSTHRGTYWPHRIRNGGEILVPGRKTDQVQQIDVRDLTEFMIHLLESETHGTYNITGPANPTSMEEFIYGVKGAFASEVSWTWIEDYDFLEEQGIFWAIPWIMAKDDNRGSQTINIDRAKAAGLRFRSIAQTAVDTMEWFDSLDDETRAGVRWLIPSDREADALAAWKARGR